MDRNRSSLKTLPVLSVALRKESVDRNKLLDRAVEVLVTSLSARRAWIEMWLLRVPQMLRLVALRKESVDRNTNPMLNA